jgi:hypothetical protein
VNKISANKRQFLTDSSKDDATAESIILLDLMLARTGAPKPIEESCRLVYLIERYSKDIFHRNQYACKTSV